MNEEIDDESNCSIDNICVFYVYYVCVECVRIWEGIGFD